MTPNKTLLILLLAFPFVACGGGASDPKPDTAIPVDVAKPTDVPLRDGSINPTDAPKFADGPVDVAKDVSADVPVVDVAVDRSAIGDAGDAGDVADAGPETGDAGDTGIQLNRVFACTKDTDCCTVVDTCMSTAYLYSKGIGASPAPSIPPNNGFCNACISPPIQLKCQAGTCVGEKVGTFDSKLMAAHCGYIPAADAGFHAPPDASVQPAKTSWSCGS